MRYSEVKYTDIAVRNEHYHTATGAHTTYAITQCYLPPGRGDIAAFTSTEAGTRFSDPEGCKAELHFFCGIDMERTYVSVTLRVGEDAAVKGYGDNCGDCGAGQQQQQPSGPAGYQCCPVSDTIKVSLTVDRGGAGVDRPRASPECPGRRCRAPPADKTPRQRPAAVNSERAR